MDTANIPPHLFPSSSLVKKKKQKNKKQKTNFSWARGNSEQYIPQVDMVMWLSSVQGDLSGRAVHNFWEIS